MTVTKLMVGCSEEMKRTHSRLQRLRWDFCFANGETSECKSIFAKHADDSSLNLHIIGGNDNRRHVRIGRLQANFARAFAIKALQCGLFAAHQSHHDVAWIGDLGLLAYDVIAIHDVVLDHRSALYLKGEGIAAAGEIAEGESC